MPSDPVPRDDTPTQRVEFVRGYRDESGEISTDARLVGRQLAALAKFATTIRELEEDNTHAQMLQIAAKAMTNLIADPTTRASAIMLSGVKPHQYRAVTLNDRPADASRQVNEALGPIAKYFRDTFIKILPYEGGKSTSRLEREAKRIMCYMDFNERVEDLRGIENYNPVPRVLALQSKRGLSVIAEERIEGKCLYERLCELHNQTQSVRFKAADVSRKRRRPRTRKASKEDEIRRFSDGLGQAIDRIVIAQSATLGLPEALIDDVQEPTWESIRDTGKLDEGARRNASFYHRQILKKFVGNGRPEPSGFPGALNVLLSPEESSAEADMIERLKAAIGPANKTGVYYPIAYILGELPPGVDCDRSLWNILYDESNETYPMVDFETVTNSPHAIALANATAQGLYIFNQSEKLKHSLELEGEVVFKKGRKIGVRDKLRWRYMSGWNREIRANAEAGLYGDDFDVEEHLLTDFDEFKLGHAAAGVQRALVHCATFVKIMYNMVLDEDATGYALARKGMEISLTHANESISDFRTIITHDSDIVRRLYSAGVPRDYRRGLGELLGALRDIRKHIKQPYVRSAIRDKIAERCYRR